MARGPGSTGSPGWITPARGRLRTHEPRGVGERGRLEGGSLAAMPTRPRGSRGRSSWPCCAESLCAAAGAGGRWLLRILSRRRVTGRQGGWVGEKGGGGWGRGAPHRVRGGSTGRAAGARSPRLGAGGPDAARGRGRGSRGGAAGGSGIGGLDQGRGLGPRRRGGGDRGGRLPHPWPVHLRALRVWTRGDGGRLGPLAPWSLETLCRGFLDCLCARVRGCQGSTGGRDRSRLRLCDGSLSHLLCAPSGPAPGKWPLTLA